MYKKLTNIIMMAKFLELGNLEYMIEIGCFMVNIDIFYITIVASMFKQTIKIDVFKKWLSWLETKFELQAQFPIHQKENGETD